MTLIGDSLRNTHLGADLVLVSLISGGVVCSASGDTSGLFSLTVPVLLCWTLPYQRVYLLNKIHWLQNGLAPTCVWAGFFAGPILQKSESVCFQLVCLEQIFPRPFLILLSDLLRHFRECDCLTSSFTLPYCSSCLSLHSSIP